MQPPRQYSRTSTPPPLADLHGPLGYWAPAPPGPQSAEDGRHAARVAAWVQVLRGCEAAYARQAAAAGAPCTPLADDERRAVAEIAVALGVPAEAAAADRLTALLRVA